MAALIAKIMDRTVIAEQNVVRADIMVAPLDSIHDIIKTYHWGYLHNCACVVLTRLVRLFSANLEVVQDDDHAMVLQSSVERHVITCWYSFRYCAVSPGDSLPPSNLQP